MIAFGPVPSRRLGLSLGINNIVSRKACTYICIYCQIGQTKYRQTKRESFYEAETLIRNVKEHLGKLDPKHLPDYLTFVSNGEPSLDINLGAEIKLLQDTFLIPVAVISNASLIGDDRVRNELMHADWVSLKVDSVEQETWEKINRPHHNIQFENLTGFEGTNTGFTGNAYEDILNITAVHPLRDDTLRELLKKENTGMDVIESLMIQRYLKKNHYNGHNYYVRNYYL